MSKPLDTPQNTNACSFFYLLHKNGISTDFKLAFLNLLRLSFRILSWNWVTLGHLWITFGPLLDRPAAFGPPIFFSPPIKLHWLSWILNYHVGFGPMALLFNPHLFQTSVQNQPNTSYQPPPPRAYLRPHVKLLAGIVFGQHGAHRPDVERGVVVWGVSTTHRSQIQRTTDWKC